MFVVVVSATATAPVSFSLSRRAGQASRPAAAASGGLKQIHAADKKKKKKFFSFDSTDAAAAAVGTTNFTKVVQLEPKAKAGRPIL